MGSYTIVHIKPNWQSPIWLPIRDDDDCDYGGAAIDDVDNVAGADDVDDDSDDNESDSFKLAWSITCYTRNVRRENRWTLL